MIFYLGVHQPHWLSKADVPLFISARRLRDQKRWRPAVATWALDSGGFSELSLHGRWLTTPEQYAEEAQRWAEQIGSLAWAAQQDWMCEPFMIEKTGLSIREHQHRTIENYLKLRQLAPEFPWVPVLQGWHHDDYLCHVGDWHKAGVTLRLLPLVGLGSVCRRQDTLMAEELIRELHGEGIKLHLFGFKLKGLPRVSHYAASSDSMAWSLAARRNQPLPGCTHRNCANCLKYALLWRQKAIQATHRPTQLTMFRGGSVSIAAILPMFATGEPMNDPESVWRAKLRELIDATDTAESVLESARAATMQAEKARDAAQAELDAHIAQKPAKRRGRKPKEQPGETAVHAVATDVTDEEIRAVGGGLFGELPDEGEGPYGDGR